MRGASSLRARTVAWPRASRVMVAGATGAGGPSGARSPGEESGATAGDCARADAAGDTNNRDTARAGTSVERNMLRKTTAYPMDRGTFCHKSG